MAGLRVSIRRGRDGGAVGGSSCVLFCCSLSQTTDSPLLFARLTLCLHSADHHQHHRQNRHSDVDDDDGGSGGGSRKTTFSGRSPIQFPAAAEPASNNNMSLFEITSLDSDSYKLFDDDPFLLEPDDSCLADDGSDETDSLTGTLSPTSQSQPSLTMRPHVCKQEPPDSPILEPEILTHDVYLEVHNYCIGVAPSVRSSASSPGLQQGQESSHSVDVVSDEQQEDLYDMDDDIDCDEDDDDLLKCSRKSSSSSSSPTSSLGHRRKSMMDKCLSEEEKRLLLKEGYNDFPENGTLSKGEEKILRKIRRKIRNKKSAQCSRQRKKEYVEQLEKKYSKCTNENLLLKKELIKLRRENSSLAMKIKNMLADGSADVSDQASFKTSFFVLCISFLLIIFPFIAPDAMEDMGMMAGRGEDGMMPGRHLLMASNFSPHDLYGESHYVASAINSTTDQLLSISF